MGAGQGWRAVRWPPGIQAAMRGPDFWRGGREDGGRESMQHPGRVCVCVGGVGVESGPDGVMVMLLLRWERSQTSRLPFGHCRLEVHVPGKMEWKAVGYTGLEVGKLDAGVWGGIRLQLVLKPWA